MASVAEMKGDLNRYCQIMGVSTQVSTFGSANGFSSEVSIPGVNFVGRAEASNKKGAADAASWELHTHLVQSGLLQEALASAQPSANKKKKTGKATSTSITTEYAQSQTWGGHSGWGEQAGGKGAADWGKGGYQAQTAYPRDNSATTSVTTSVIRPTIPKATALMSSAWGSKGAGKSSALAPTPLRPAAAAANLRPTALGGANSKGVSKGGPPTMPQARAARPPTPAPAAASNEVVEDGMGNFNLATGRSRLVDQLKKWKQPSDVQVEMIGPPHSPTFRASLSFRCPKLNRWFNESLEGTSKKTVQQELCLQVARKLFRLGVMPAFSTSVWKKSSSHEGLKDTKYHQEGLFGFGIDPSTKENLRSYLSEAGVDLGSGHGHAQVGEVLRHGTLSLAQAEPPKESPANANAQPLPWTPPGEPMAKPWPRPKWNVHPGQPDPSLRQLAARLPVTAKAQEIVDAVAQHRAIIIQGSTGCGKTTQVPQLLLDMQDGYEKTIVVVQPRRLPAITVAQRVATERGEELGGSVGYAVRFDQVWPRQSNSICYMTTGFLIARLHSRGLHGISHIVMDEVHERDINNDLLLGLLRSALATHKGLKIILMSATIDPVQFQLYLESALAEPGTENQPETEEQGPQVPVLCVEGRLFEVETMYLEDIIEQLNWRPPQKSKDQAQDSMLTCDPAWYSPSTQQALSAMNEQMIPLELVRDILHLAVPKLHQEGNPGSILIFMPTWGMMSYLLKLLTAEVNLVNTCHWVMLHSRVPKDEQMAAFRPAPEGKTKVVIATNIAESSVTIDDVCLVIDSCRVKVNHYSDATGLSLHEVNWTGRMNMEQRKGRAGRTGPGSCFRLCTRRRFDEGLEDLVPPEMTRAPLDETLLLVKSLRVGDAREILLNCLDPPSEAALARAAAELKALRAVDETGELTAVGRILARMPVGPKIGLALLMGHWFFRLGDAMATICASMSFEEPFSYDKTAGYLSWSVQEKYAGKGKHSDPFVLAMVHQEYARLLEQEGEKTAQQFCDSERLNIVIMRQVHAATEQLRGILSSAALGSLACGEILQGPEDGEVLEDEQIQSKAPRNFNAVRDWAPQEWEWGAIQLLLASAMPHLAVHQEKRLMWTNEQTLGAVFKGSVNCSKGAYVFPSPVFAFLEQVKDGSWKPPRCRQLTNVVPNLLLMRPFSSASIEVGEENHVLLDGWIKLGPASTDSLRILVGLSHHLEDLIADAAEQVSEGASAAQISEAYSPLLTLLKGMLTQRGLRYKELPGNSWQSKGPQQASQGSWGSGRAYPANPKPQNDGRPAFRPFAAGGAKGWGKKGW